ncbi:hypothetical protein ACJMK2_014568 [Sinanodonta woodiana]|uniref:DNA topoisomerase 2 n=1 Tax=Sinanodonta woodiana TaxID=1069815 RepID=A0ABD3V495_SINWO
MAQKAVDGYKWQTLFDNMNAKAAAGGGGGDVAAKPTSKNKPAKAAPRDDVENMDEYHLPAGGDGEGKSQSKRMSIERIYQKKTQLEHILLRPDTYIGSIEMLTQPMWVLDEENNCMIQRDITYVPGLYKIFDEILVNAADNKQRDPKMSCLKIDIDPESGKIRIWNNGKGIPVVEHKEHKMFVPTMIFGHLLTSSNYDDTEKKVTGGRNGYGAKLCNIFSKKFIVETSFSEYKKAFKQTWVDNMGKTKEPTITEAKDEDFTCVTFFPDLEKFKMEKLDKDIVDLFVRRAYDIAASTKGVKVILNGKRIPVKGFKDYVELYIKNHTDEAGQPLKIVYENVNDRWEVAVAMSDKGFQQASFVNSIATTKGGRHVDYIADQVVQKLIDVVKKKNKGGISIKPFQVKNHLWVFVNCLIENPTFDSQTKENMTLQAKSFGSKCMLGEKFIQQVNKCGIVESILSWMKFKAQSQLNRKFAGAKHSKLKGIPKLDDANDAGTRSSIDCTLILTEGDSAKTLAVAGLSVVGRDKFGVFPLKGKVLNVREATHKQIMDNAEINNIIKIVGLQFKEKYEDPDKLKALRYGKIMIMTDQDQDGSHIKGLLVNFIHHFWPNLLRYNFLEEFITPIVKVTKGKEEKAFYSIPEFEEWKKATETWHTWKVKYYKGLGTSTAKEAKDYFSEMERHRIPFKYAGPEDDASINLAFSKKKIEERKEWLTNWMDERKRREEMGLPELYLYDTQTRQITYNDFINRELILFSNMDNVRSIPSLVDGFKPGQRKVIYTCFKRNLVKEIKVAQLAGSVSEQSAYHHGEASLMGTIINLAQNFVGSNNLNLLQPIGQFGTRLHGGKDAASPRYIFTSLSPLARMVFNQFDDPLLDYQYDDNQKIEPNWYMPIIPMVLVNGAEGIGTGWSTKIPNYDIREIISNIKRMIDRLEPIPMLPSFKNFKGAIEEVNENKYVVSGEVSIVDDQTIEITELPVRTWTQQYKEEVLEPMLNGTDKTPALIMDYKEYHTDTTVKFVVKMSPDKLAQAEEQGLHKVFKLQTSISTSSMVLFDHNGCIKRFNKVDEILQEFFDVRLEYYKKRKAYLEGMIAAESLKLDNIARFIMEKIDGTVVVENKPKKELIQLLVRRGYDSDPAKAWKEAQNKGKEVNDSEDSEDESKEDTSSGPDFNYILGMPIWNLTKERKDELLKQRDKKAAELADLKKKTPTDLWSDDLEKFLVELDVVEKQERDDDVAHLNKPIKITKGKGKPRKIAIEETKPSPMGRRVVPRVDSAFKIKAEKEAIRKQKLKDKREAQQDGGNILDFMKDEEEEDEPKSLMERLNLKKELKDEIKTGEQQPKKEKKPRAPRAPKGAKKSPKKKGRNPWSSDEDVISDVSDISDMDGSFLESVPKLERAPRRAAAAKVKYNYDEDEEGAIESDGGEFQSTQSDDEPRKMDTSSDKEDFDTKVKTIPAKKAAPQPRAVISSDEEDEVEENGHMDKLSWIDEPAKNDLNEKSSSPPQSSSNPMFDDSDDEEPLIVDLVKPLATLEKNEKKPQKKAAVEKKDKAPKEKKPRKPKKRDWDGSDEEIKPKKGRKPGKKAARMNSDESEDEFVPKKKSTAAKKRKADDSEDDSFMVEDLVSVPSAPARERPGRARAAVKYTEDSDDDFDEF